MMKIGPFLKPDLDLCVKRIIQKQKKRIGLQFSETDLIHAAETSRYVKSELEKNSSEKSEYVVVVLSDVARSFCCVDFITAAHIQCDFVVHFGEVCSFPPSTSPEVYYIYPSLNFNSNSLIETLKNSLTDLNFNPETLRLVLGFDFEFLHVLDNDKDFLTKLNSEIMDSLRSNKKSFVVDIVRRDELCGDFGSFKDSNLIWIGRKTDFLLSFLLANEFNTSFTFNFYESDKNEWELEAISANSLLSQRYYLIEKIREAKIIGILITSFSSEKYVKIVDYLKSLVRKSGKRVYVISFGKITEPKLENYPSIDIFVSVCCPLGNLISPRAFAKEVANPLDLEIALNKKEWTGKYNFSIGKLNIFNGNNKIDEQSKQKRSTEILQERKNILKKCDCEEIALGIQKMSYFGLEGDSEEKDVAPSTIKDGLHGIARCYEGDH